MLLLMMQIKIIDFCADVPAFPCVPEGGKGLAGLGELSANLNLSVSSCRHLTAMVGENLDFTYLSAIQSYGIVSCGIHVLGLLTAESQTKVPCCFGHVICLCLHILVAAKSRSSRVEVRAHLIPLCVFSMNFFIIQSRLRMKTKGKNASLLQHQTFR